MQGCERFTISSFIDNRAQESWRSDTEDVQDSSGPEDAESGQEIRHSVTSFSVKDILDPLKFNAPKRRLSESDSETEGTSNEESRNNSWHPWMAATRFNRSQKSHGKSFNSQSSALW